MANFRTDRSNRNLWEGERDSRAVSLPSLVESGPLRGGKCRAAILYDVRKTYASARQRYEAHGTGREEGEREREKDNTERGVSAGVQIYAGATLMSAFVLFQRVYTLRIRSVVERNSDREISFRTFIHSRDSRIRISSYTFYYSAQRFVAMFTYLN